jgi:LPXTG-motif cell wall-anchored protein
MTSLQKTSLRTTISAFCGLAIAAGLALTPARADEFNKRTILTVSQTVQIGDAVLQPGQYVIKLLDSQTDRQVVQIFNKDQKHIIATVVTVPLERLTPRGHTTFSFYETPVGTARALRSWYYPGDEVGHKFIEPKHHEMLAANTGVVENPLAFNEEAQTQTTTTTASNEPPATAPTTQSSVEEQSADRQVTEPATPAPAAEPAPAQTEVAQTTTAAATTETATTEPAPAAPADQPAELPQTGTSYPEIGLLGAMLLALAGLARVLRRA